MRATLIRIDEKGARERYHLRGLPITLGRSDAADLQISDPWASRVHCRIEIVGGTLLVCDLDSCNGTSVNGCHISQSPLMPGDELGMGTTTFKVVYERYLLGPLPQVVYARSGENLAARHTAVE